MSTEKLRKILDEQTNNQLKIINERVSGIFLYGFIVGIIMSYSGFLSYFAGIGTGIVVSRKYKYISHQITEKVSYIFQNVINRNKFSINGEKKII
jgi:hypothetical protein